MIRLDPNKHRHYTPGEVLHLKVVSMQETRPGWWVLKVDDVTPLPGAEPDGYGCHICGIIDNAKEDGGLPDGWTEKKFQEGSCFVCSKCQDQPICKVCGCTDEGACQTAEGSCHWVEPDLCSACAGKPK